MLFYFKAYFLKHLNSYKDFITGRPYLSNQKIHAFKIHYLKQRFSDRERTSVKNHIRRSLNGTKEKAIAGKTATGGWKAASVASCILCRLADGIQEKNLWLYSLTDTLKDMSVTKQLLEDYKKNKEDQLYQAVMEIIVKANENRLKEGKRDMCNALLELMKDELDEKREEGIKEGESLGENRINQLILKLSELNRTDEILKAAADREYQKKLLKEFGL